MAVANTPSLDDAIKEWKEYNQSNQFESEFNKLIAEGNIDEQKSTFLSRLNFGTAGIRGKMGPGFSKMNDVVIIQTGQGLLKYLQSFGDDLCTKGIVIGMDGRHNSQRFAELTATIFIAAGVPVYLFSRVCPTPLVSFSVKHFGLKVGVMITASHNQMEYNGYKVYWENGSQIISPHDKGIQSYIQENLVPLESSWNTEILTNNPLLHDPLDSVMEAYRSIVLESDFNIDADKAKEIVFTYTPLHGVGFTYLADIIERMKLKLIPVEEQKDPDPEFPTVRYPNPEEGEHVFKLAIDTANRNNSSIILANDPDADRLGVAEKDPKTGKWKIFSGNEIGALLGWWIMEVHSQKYSYMIRRDCYLLSTIVSSRLVQTMANKFGYIYEDTLTGFKWIGNRISELNEQNKKVLFAFEEAIGFLCHSEIRDKDGISAAAKLAELVSYLYPTGRTLEDKLEEIYTLFGYHLSENSYFTCYDKNVISRIFHRLRNYDSSDSYPRNLRDGKYAIIGVRDLAKEYDETKVDNKATLPCSELCETITFWFENGFACTFRTSGTEPKIKYYMEICYASVMTKEALLSILRDMTDASVEEFLQPQENGLIPKS